MVDQFLSEQRQHENGVKDANHSNHMLLDYKCLIIVFSKRYIFFFISDKYYSMSVPHTLNLPIKSPSFPAHFVNSRSTANNPSLRNICMRGDSREAQYKEELSSSALHSNSRAQSNSTQDRKGRTTSRQTALSLLRRVLGETATSSF